MSNIKNEINDRDNTPLEELTDIEIEMVIKTQTIVIILLVMLILFLL